MKVRWNKKVALEIEKVVERFNTFLQSNVLEADWRVECAPGFTEKEINDILAKLEMENAPVYWDEKTIEMQREEATVQDLSELGVGLHFRPRKRKHYS